MAKKDTDLVYWTPRVLSIALLCFLALFSLDVFQPGLSVGEILLGLFMHNIPVLILAVLVYVSWKYEIVGAAAFILAGLLYIVNLTMGVIGGRFEWYMLSWLLTIAGPAFLVGGLFLVDWRRKKTPRKKPTK